MGIHACLHTQSCLHNYESTGGGGEVFSRIIKLHAGNGEETNPCKLRLSYPLCINCVPIDTSHVIKLKSLVEAIWQASIYISPLSTMIVAKLD